MSSAVLAIDQGTTGTRTILYDSAAKSVSSAYQEFRQFYPRPGWVEHNPVEIWRSTLAVIKRAVASARRPLRIAAVGITNQRETTVLWDKKTGRPVGPAIVWQDRRTSDFCSSLKRRGLEKIFRDKTGLVLDPYFSGTKIHWMCEHIPGLRRKIKSGNILFGTIDTWLLWNLTGGRSHKTDFTNASRTLVFNIRKQNWDSELLRLLKIDRSLLPEVQNSVSDFGRTAAFGPLRAGIPISSMAGDQQAALYGQACYHAGEVKNTYGTGCFLVLNVGKKFRRPPFGLLATLACDELGRPAYAFEGSVFIAGAAIQWLRDGLGFFKHAGETAALARRVKDSGGVVFIPAFAGLGSPYWNPYVRGMITGITRGTRREHIVRAALESLAQQSADVLDAMQKGSGKKIRELKVDGGATRNSFLMQFQADLLGIPILVSERAESTAWGAAKLAGLGAGLWSEMKSVDRTNRYRRYAPRRKRPEASGLRAIWKTEIARLLFPPRSADK